MKRSSVRTTPSHLCIWMKQRKHQKNLKKSSQKDRRKMRQTSHGSQILKIFQGEASDPLTKSCKLRTKKLHLDLALWRSLMTKSFTNVGAEV